MAELLVLVFATRPSERALAPRTMRALWQEGLSPVDATQGSFAEIAKELEGRAVWLVRAGAFPASVGSFALPPPSALQKPLVALGATVSSVFSGQAKRAEAFEQLIRQTGGDLSSEKVKALPALSSVYIEQALANEVAQKLLRGEPLEASVLALSQAGRARLVRFSPLDVLEDEALRVLLVVTSLQQGGAEKMVLDLAEVLPRYGVRPRIVTLGRPTRDTFAAPLGTIDLMRERDRIASLAQACQDEAADLVHAHLMTGPELRRLAELGVPPVVVTVHNTQEGWPLGFAELGERDASLLVACSFMAEADLASAGFSIPRRTVWNGIDLGQWRPSKRLADEGAKARRALGFGKTDCVLVVVANPRPQKRLERLPPLLAGLRARFAELGIRRQARLVLVGDKDPQAEAAKQALAGFQKAVEEHGVGRDVRLVGSTRDVAPMLAAADALVSTSAHEGLSLAHLEALAMGLPVFATDAGGTREIALEAPSLCVMPKEIHPVQMGERIAEALANAPAERPRPALSSFSRETMAKRYALLYERALARARWRAGGRGQGRGQGRGLVLVTNNFSTGGAQSSARRLLLGLRDAGEHVRAVVLEEQPAWPTPGRKALVDAGIEVLALPEVGSIEIGKAVQKLFTWLDADPPEALVFWNALAPYKLLIADQCLDIPLYDVSPGEMFFASLEKYLSKTHARLDVPFRDARDYGARLAGVIVKYAGEARLAGETLGVETFVVPNGVPLPPKRTPRKASERLLLGTSARLSPQKKLEELLDALRLALPRLPPCTLRIAGGPERGSEAYAEALKKRAEGLPVEWLGEVEVATMLAEIELFLMISEPAGCPNASLEAMAEGLPVIATDVGGASEQVQDGVTGRLVPRGDVHAFAEALVELGNDPVQRQRLGEGARRRVEERFDVARMVAEYRRILLGRGS